MIKLITKFQYVNFEPGEFIEVQERAYDEVVELIENYPWNKQRDKIVIELTNPSITIEGKNKDFLKLALFFNQKYVLYYFDETKNLYTKSFYNLKDSFVYIKKIFNELKFDTTDFKRELTWFQNNLKHFVTKDFRYVLTRKSISNYILSTSGMNFFLSIFVLFIFLLKGVNSINLLGSIVILAVIFLIGGGVHLIIFFNYYRYIKDKILIMSKGNEIFYFGNIDTLTKYNKSDILQYYTIRSRGSRNLFSGFAIIKIEFKNGTVIKIPNLLIDYLEMEQKLFECPRVEVNKLPLL